MRIEESISIPTKPYYDLMLSQRFADNPTTEPRDKQHFAVVYIVGTGGTGGYVIRDLSRYISSLPYASRIQVVLLDGDTVEEKNINRQNFIRKDINKNKAEVLAERYSTAFNCPIAFHKEHLTEKNIGGIISPEFAYEMCKSKVTLNEGVSQTISIHTIVISCVDNNKTRTLLSGFLGCPGKTVEVKNRLNYKFPVTDTKGINSCEIDTITWIDAGNETTTGQVICYYDAISSFNNTFYQEEKKDKKDEVGFFLFKANWNNPRFEEHKYETSGEYLSSFLTAMVTIGKENETSEDVILKVTEKVPANPEESIKRGSDFYFNMYKMKTTNPKSTAFRDLLKAYDPAKPGANMQLGFILGEASANQGDILSSFLTWPSTYMYANILAGAKDKLNTELSCAEQAIIDPQTQMVNMQAATYILNYFSKIIPSNPKNAFLNSFGCAWSGNNCKEMFITESSIASNLRALVSLMDKGLVEKVKFVKIDLKKDEEEAKEKEKAEAKKG